MVQNKTVWLLSIDHCDMLNTIAVFATAQDGLE